MKYKFQKYYKGNRKYYILPQILIDLEMEELVNNFDKKFDLKAKLGDQFQEFKSDFRKSLETNIKKVKKELENDMVKCAAKTRRNKPCKNNPAPNSEFCKKHFDYNPNQVIMLKKLICNGGSTNSGTLCTRVGSVKPDGSRNFYCDKHIKNWKEIEQNTSNSDSDEDLELSSGSDSSDSE